MKTNLYFTMRACLLLFLTIFYLVPGFSQTSQNYKIKANKISSGATPIQIAQSFKAHSTVGQSTSSPTLKNTTYYLTSGFVGIINIKVTEVETPDGFDLPLRYRLYQNYPNPFNPETNIRFDVKKQTRVVLKVYDLLGRELMVLIDALHQPGCYKVTFDAAHLPSGLYFYRIQMKDFVDVKKMVLLE